MAQEAMLQEESKQREVPEKLDRLGALVEELDKCIGMLDERLRPVLRVATLENSVEEKKPHELVPLALRLEDRCQHIERLIQRVGYMQQEVQI